MMGGFEKLKRDVRAGRTWVSRYDAYTIRDAQRIIAQAKRADIDFQDYDWISLDSQKFYGYEESLKALPLWQEGIKPEAWLAKLARKYGANTKFRVLQERKKDTDEVDGSTKTGDQTHGGDSSSGEVPEGESQSGASPDEEGEGLGLGETAEEAEEVGGAANAKHLRKLFRKAAKRKDGLPSDPTAKFSDVSRDLRQRAQQALADLVGSHAQEDGPRWDAQKLCERLLTRRPLQASKKAELSRPAILVVADVSGSCSSFSRPACNVALAASYAGVPGADVICVSVTNVWYLVEVLHNGRPVRDFPRPTTGGQVYGERGDPVAFVQWAEAKFGVQIEVVVALGDGDEVESYNDLACMPQIERVIWLDNYDCNRHLKPKRRKLSQGLNRGDSAILSRRALEKIQYFVGCANESSMIEGLRMAVRA